MAVKHQMKLWVVALAALLSYGIVLSILSQQQAPQQNIAENQAPDALPAASFYDAAGKAVTLADFKGHPVLVNLWATWCPPCVAELPSLDKLQAKLKNKGLIVVAISMDHGDDMTPIAKFLHKQRIEHLSPYWDKDRAVSEAWHAEDLPVSYFIGKDGKVVKKYEGTFTWDKGEMYRAVEAFVK